MEVMKTWVEFIQSNYDDEWHRTLLINEMVRTVFRGNVPAEVELLKGNFVDLGFDRLGLAPEQHHTIMWHSVGWAFVCLRLRIG